MFNYFVGTTKLLKLYVVFICLLLETIRLAGGSSVDGLLLYE